MADTITIPVTGMTCQHCVASVTKALSAVAKVQSVDVSLERGEAVVKGDGVSADELCRTIDDLGFEAGNPS